MHTRLHSFASLASLIPVGGVKHRVNGHKGLFRSKNDARGTHNLHTELTILAFDLHKWNTLRVRQQTAWAFAVGDATFQKLHGGVWEADIQDLAVELKVQQEWVCARVRVVLHHSGSAPVCMSRCVTLTVGCEACGKQWGTPLFFSGLVEVGGHSEAANK